MPLSKWVATLVDALNLYRGADYSPPASSATNVALQAGFTALALPLALFFFVQGMLGIVGVPLVTSTTILRPEPAQVQQLFAQLASRELSALSCPCRNSRTSLASVSAWSAPEDPYCTALREVTIDEPLRQSLNFSSPPPLFSFSDYLGASDGSRSCMSPLDFAAFKAHVNESLAVSGGLFSGIPSEQQPAALLQLATSLQVGLCGSAFGGIRPQLFPNRPSGIGPTDLASGCPQDKFPFQPKFFSLTSSPGNFVQLQWTRSFTSSARVWPPVTS